MTETYTPTVGDPVKFRTVLDGDPVLGLDRLVEWHHGTITALTETDGRPTVSFENDDALWFAVPVSDLLPDVS